MINQNTIDDILNSVNIIDTVSQHVTLKKTGVNHKGCCPFHNEKTPSFTVSESKQIFKCFGCGESGNVVSFLMRVKNMSYPEAIDELAKKVNIEIKEQKFTPQQEKEQKKKDTLYIIYKEAAFFYRDQLNKNSKALEYVKERWSEEIFKLYDIGYAPDSWDSLYNYLRSKGFLSEILDDCGLFREKNHKVYDFFRNRIMIPIYDRMGRIISFSGRDFSGDKDQAKYINGQETIIYNKSNTLFGLNIAIPAIRKYDVSILVEGNPDVIKMHQLDVNNIVAGCGTALTENQIHIMGKYSRNICLLYDNDAAGKKAVHRSAELIIKKGFNPLVLEIPEGENGEKQDPDSFFSSQKHFSDFYTKNCIPYPVYLAKQKSDKCKNNASYSGNTINEIAAMIFQKDASEREALIEVLAKIIPSKKVWNQAIKSLEKGKHQEEIRISENGRTNEQNKMIERYGFYVERNCYHFMEPKNKEYFFEGSNFTMEPLFHIESAVKAKRLYKLTNVFGVSKEIEFAQSELISLSAFKTKCEGIGNFRFDAGEYGLSKIKAYLYEKTKTCTEITQLGWKKEGFWAWGNGISYNNTFIPVNEYGICTFESNHYYIPAISSFYAADETLFMFERRFIHKQGDISLEKWMMKFCKVYGKGSVVLIAFYMSTLFRDVYFRTFKSFPILNLFGPKGTGKSMTVISLLRLFGNISVGVNMTNSTIPAMADHVSQTCNSICHIDEYKNHLEPEKIEFAKGLFDGTGRNRMNMDKDKKREMTAVDAGILLSGQEMATQDNALFSRMLFYALYKNKFSDEEKQKYEELKQIEEQGLTHITNQIISYRSYFVSNYMSNYNEAHNELGKKLNKLTIEERIWNNWVVILTTLRTLKEKIKFPFKYEHAIDIVSEFCKKQNEETRANNEVSNFWDIYVYLVREGILEIEYDYRIDNVAALKTDKIDSEAERKIICVDMVRTLQLYSKHGKQSSHHILPIASMKYYLQNSPEYLGRKVSRLKRRSNLLQEKSSTKGFVGDGSEPKVETYTIKTEVFDYAKLGLDIETTKIDFYGNE